MWNCAPHLEVPELMNRAEYNNGRTVADVLADMKEELREFVETRLTMLKTELQDKLQTLKIALPLVVVGVVLLGTAYLLFTLAAVGLVAAFLPDSPYRWCFAFLAIAALWTVLGGIAAYLAKYEFAMKEMMPRKTIEVLKQDKLWIQAEVKTQV
jgi:uncharacterized membrane protein YqjE